MADKLNRVGVKIAPEVHRDINMESARTGTPIYTLLERAWKEYRSGKSSTATSDKSEALPTEGTGSKSGIYNSGKSTSMDSPRQFLERISSLLQSVPEDSRPAVEEYLATVATRAVEPFTTGVQIQNEQQRAANQPASDSEESHFDELHEFPDKPKDARHIPAKQA